MSMFPYKTKLFVFPEIITINGIANFILNGAITIGLSKLWSNRQKILENFRTLYFKSIFVEKQLLYSWYWSRIEGSGPLDHKTSKALVDSIIIQYKFDKEGADEGFRTFAPLFKQVYPEAWKHLFGEKKIPYLQRDNGEIVYL